ncbi:MAG: DNA-binding protein [Deltaproteobacteria bacterium]|nr:MAG: DNA-binding protein [Deltaproteobacteria bacterium]
MKKVTFVGIILILGFIWVATSYGQQVGDVWATRGQYTWLFDAKTMETLTGEVVAIGKFAPRGKPYGVRFTLKTEQGPIEVILGRGSYVEQQGLRLEPQDKVTVKGSRVAVEGKPTVIATEVTKGEKTLKLRDANGMPLWNRQSSCAVSE